jgi:hypothetical protein
MKFIKTIAIHTLLTLISGLILLCVAALGVFAWENYKYGKNIEPSRIFKEVETVYDHHILSTDLQITDLAREEGLVNFTVKGKIKNVSQRTYFSFYVSLEYSVEEIKMGECHHYNGESFNLKPGESIGFLVECSDFQPKKLPSQFSFKALVKSASRYINNF